MEIDMENDNNGGGIASGANDIGSFEGSVVGGGPTDPLGGPDASGIGISGGDKSANGSADAGGKLDFGSPGSLDTDLQPASPTTVIIDSQHLDQPSQPSFVTASLSIGDVSKLAGNLASAAVTAAAILTGAPSAAPLAVLTLAQLVGNLSVLESATKDAQVGMGNPGAFSTDSAPSSLGANGVTEQSPVLSWDQMNPSAGGGGSGGGG
jgi:hypothetical protein